MKLKIVFVAAVLWVGVPGHAAPQPEDDIISGSGYESFISNAATPLAAAMEYFKRFGDELKIKPGLLRSYLSPATNLIASVGEEYRLYRNQYHQERDMTQIVFQQTYFGLPTYDGYIEAGVRPGDNGSWDVLYATVRIQAGRAPEKPSQDSMDRLWNLDEKTFARMLGLSSAGQHSKTNRADADQLPEGIPGNFEVDAATFKIYDRKWMIYCYDANDREIIGSNTFAPSPRPYFPLPTVDKRIQEHQQYVVMRITFDGGSPRAGVAQGYACIEPETLSVLYLNAW